MPKPSFKLDIGKDRGRDMSCIEGAHSVCPIDVRNGNVSTEITPGLYYCKPSHLFHKKRRAYTSYTILHRYAKSAYRSRYRPQEQPNTPRRDPFPSPIILQRYMDAVENMWEARKLSERRICIAFHTDPSASCVSAYTLIGSCNPNVYTFPVA
jgi:hypothetical protein